MIAGVDEVAFETEVDTLQQKNPDNMYVQVLEKGLHGNIIRLLFQQQNSDIAEYQEFLDCSETVPGLRCIKQLLKGRENVHYTLEDSPAILALLELALQQEQENSQMLTQLLAALAEAGTRVSHSLQKLFTDKFNNPGTSAQMKNAIVALQVACVEQEESDDDTVIEDDAQKDRISQKSIEIVLEDEFQTMYEYAKSCDYPVIK